MRRTRTLLFTAFSALTLITSLPAHAQYGGGGGGGGGRGGRGGEEQQDEEETKRKKRDAEFGGANLSLPKVRNAGPCPYVKVLYDAARYVEFGGNAEASASVAYTGEMQNIASGCAYRGTDPILIRSRVLFEFGRGPKAGDSRKVYRYWVAVTDRNHAVLDKEYYGLTVNFPAGRDRVTISEDLGQITIPRADTKVSGANFEVLIGFDVTPAMAAFNRDGKRFRPNAGQSSTAPATQP